MIEDVVCGMDVDLRQAEARGLISEYGGALCCFCSPLCKSAFDQQPQLYAWWTVSVAGVVQPQAAAALTAALGAPGVGHPLSPDLIDYFAHQRARALARFQNPGDKSLPAYKRANSAPDSKRHG